VAGKFNPVADEGLGENWHWLTQDEGAGWVLSVIDRLVELVEEGQHQQPHVIKSKL
jgi:hypothetical protein